MISATRSVLLLGAVLLSTAGAALAVEVDQIDRTALAHAKVMGDAHAPNRNFGGPLTTLDSLANFTGSFRTLGVDSNNNLQTNWAWAMVGNSPASGGTTVIDAPIIPVDIDLRNADGTPRYVNGVRLYIRGSEQLENVLHSPVFSNGTFTSSTEPTQWGDAILRAEFWSNMTQDWHTLLAPHVRHHRVMQFLQGTYRFALNADGSCCDFVLIDYATFGNELFPPTYPVDNSTPVGAAELAGDMTTKTIATLLFQNVFLMFNDDPTQCCVIGYHTFDFEPGATAGALPRAYVMNYSSWISPGIFNGGFQDVAALSHEMSELFNDPFVDFDGVHNQTPWWLSGGNCQNNLETGDVIEGLPNAAYPVTQHGYTYHVQNEALLQWFEFRHEPDSLDGAYSYPDPSVLPQLSTRWQAGCTKPLVVDE